MDLLMPATAETPSGAFGAVQIGLANPDQVRKLRDAAAQCSNKELGKLMLSLIDAAAGDAARIRQNIEIWYDSAMNRVSGWYKRRTHLILMFVGLAVSCGLNADAIGITRYLSTNKA